MAGKILLFRWSFGPLPESEMTPAYDVEVVDAEARHSDDVADAERTGLTSALLTLAGDSTGHGNVYLRFTLGQKSWWLSVGVAPLVPFLGSCAF